MQQVGDLFVVRRRRDPVQECCFGAFLAGPFMLYVAIQDLTSAAVDTRSDAIDRLKPVVDAWTGGKRAQFESVSYALAVNGRAPAKLEAVTTGDAVPNLTPLYGSFVDSVRRSDWTALRYSTPEGCAPIGGRPRCEAPPPAPPGDLTFTLAETAGFIAGRGSAPVTLYTPGVEACVPLDYDSATGDVWTYLQLTRVTAVVDPTKPLAAQTISGFANCSSAFGTTSTMTSQGTLDRIHRQWASGVPCSWSAFASYEKVEACSLGGPVLTVRSIDDPFIAAAFITDYTLEFGVKSTSKAGTGLFLLILGLIWTAATWGLVIYYYKKTGHHIWNAAKVRAQAQAVEQQLQSQQVPGATTATNPVALATAVAIPVGDDSIYSKQ